MAACVHHPGGTALDAAVNANLLDGTLLWDGSATWEIANNANTTSALATTPKVYFVGGNTDIGPGWSGYTIICTAACTLTFTATVGSGAPETDLYFYTVVNASAGTVALASAGGLDTIYGEDGVAIGTGVPTKRATLVWAYADEWFVVGDGIT
jgi:hypothetical protein